MKSRQWIKIIGPAIILISILVLIPAGTTWANSEMQSIPTRPPSTNTPTVTPTLVTNTLTVIPILATNALTVIPILATNTPNPGTNPGNTLVPTNTPITIIPSIISTSTNTGTLPVSLSPVPSTQTAGGIDAVTETITMTLTATLIGLTPLPGVQSFPTSTAGGPAQDQNGRDYGPVYYGLAVLVVLLIGFLWLRPRIGPGKP